MKPESAEGIRSQFRSIPSVVPGIDVCEHLPLFARHTDKTALVHVPVGKLSFDQQKLVENAMTVITAVVKAKPSAAKGKYIKSATVCSTMGPGVPLDVAAFNQKPA